MTSERELYVAHCRECGVIEESSIPANASESARDHRARTVLPGKPGHDVVALPKSVWLRGEREVRAAQNAALVAAKPAVVSSPTGGAFGNWRDFYGGLGLRVTPLHAACASCRRDPANAHKCEACRGGKRPLLSDWKAGGELVADGNVGIVCGEASRHLTVLDFDTPGTLQKLLGMSPRDVAERTLVVESSRGHHVYLHAEGVGCSKPRVCTTCWRHEEAHRAGDLCEKPGFVITFDVKGEGGQVVAPPSVHATGRRYELVRGLAVAESRIAPADALLRPEVLRLLREPFRNSRNTQHATHAPRAGPATRDALVPVDMQRVRDWVAWQSSGLQLHWRVLLGNRPPLPTEEGGRSKSDWVIALCLSEMRLSPEEIAWVLCEMPGSKAREEKHGVAYALLTARKAFALKAAQRGEPPKPAPAGDEPGPVVA